MYENVKSRVKYKNRLSENFECYLGVRQGESLSPFLFSLYLNDIEDKFYLNAIEGIDIHHIKLFYFFMPTTLRYSQKILKDYR